MLAHDFLDELLNRIVEDQFQTWQLRGGWRPAGFFPLARGAGLRRGHVQAIPAVGMAQPGQRHEPGFQFGDIQQAFAKIPKGIRHHCDRPRNNLGRDIIRNAHQRAIFQKLIELQIGGNLSRQPADDQLGDCAQTVVFRH